MSVAFAFSDRLFRSFFMLKVSCVLLFKSVLKHKIMRGGNDE